MNGEQISRHLRNNGIDSGWQSTWGYKNDSVFSIVIDRTEYDCILIGKPR